jgi:mono/diheme cytochrome c family protein
VQGESRDIGTESLSIYALQNQHPYALYFVSRSWKKRRSLMKSFVIGVLVGVLLLAGGVYYYFSSGTAPAAASDPPMPFEKKMAGMSLDAHIEKANLPSPPIPANEESFLAGAKVYKDQCATCHGLPDQPPPAISDKMYPKAPLLFKGKGVTDDPPQESYWKVTNGIRLTGMPSFKDALNDTQRWQVALLVASADKIPDSVKKELAPVPAPPMAVSAPAPPPAKAPALKK